MFDPKTILRNKRQAKALTGLSSFEFEKLLREFMLILPSKIPRGIEPKLKTARDKLFFILFYLKCYPTIDLAAAIYKVDRSQMGSSIKTVTAKNFK